MRLKATSMCIAPIGLSEVKGKRPMEVAISIAAQLVKHYEAKSVNNVSRGIQGKDLTRLHLNSSLKASVSVRTI